MEGGEEIRLGRWILRVIHCRMGGQVNFGWKF
jgi:hypothetical protein